MAEAAPSQPCRRCRDQAAVHTIRSDPLCSDCFCRFVVTKTVKRLEVLNRETRSPGRDKKANISKAFCVGLSFGPSSAALVDACAQIIQDRRARGRDAAFTLHVVHVDTEGLLLDPSEQTPPLPPAAPDQRLDRWRARYPDFTFVRVPLAAVLSLNNVDWAALGLPAATGEEARPAIAAQLRALLAGLPSATSRRDILDLLVRRLLVATAQRGPDADDADDADAMTAAPATPFHALFLGCSTTALAERALAETAKGRGFALPWQINDGPAAGGTTTTRTVPLYYPVRELLRTELVLYARTILPDGLVADADEHAAASAAAASVVSHRDLSIEQVMARYFAEVEASYPSIVANVVRTTGKLERQGGNTAAARCGVCSMPLDEAGDARWKGELGADDDDDDDGSDGVATGLRSEMDRRLCYGCERSIHG